jgi:hypothetical protein
MEIVTIVKFISLIVAAGFAVLGTTTDYKKEGQVTKYGRVAIIGVILSGLLSSVLLGMEESKKVTDKKIADNDKLDAQLDQTTGISSDVGKSLDEQQKVLRTTSDVQVGQQRVLINTLRSLMPIRRSEFAIRYTVKYPLDAEEFRSYRRRVETTVNERFPTDLGISGNDLKVFFNRDRDTQVMQRIVVYGDSPLLPDSSVAEKKAAFLLQLYDPSFFVYANTASLVDIVSSRKLPDLIFFASKGSDASFNYSLQGTVGERNPPFYRQEILFDYRAGQEGIYLTVSTNKFGSWSDNGKIAGAVDLRNALLNIEYQNFFGSDGSRYQTPEFKELSIFIGDGYTRQFVIPLKKCKPSSDKYAYRTSCRLEASEIPL